LGQNSSFGECLGEREAQAAGENRPSGRRLPAEGLFLSRPRATFRPTAADATRRSRRQAARDGETHDRTEVFSLGRDEGSRLLPDGTSIHTYSGADGRGFGTCAGPCPDVPPHQGRPRIPVRLVESGPAAVRKHSTVVRMVRIRSPRVLAWASAYMSVRRVRA
jgi:hypothetical protein